MRLRLRLLPAAARVHVSANWWVLLGAGWAWALWWLVRDARRERDYLHRAAHPPMCACGVYGLGYEGQQLLDQVDRMVHSGGCCGPEREWLI